MFQKGWEATLPKASETDLAEQLSEIERRFLFETQTKVNFMRKK